MGESGVQNVEVRDCGMQNGCLPQLREAWLVSKMSESVTAGREHGVQNERGWCPK